MVQSEPKPRRHPRFTSIVNHIQAGISEVFSITPKQKNGHQKPLIVPLALTPSLTSSVATTAPASIGSSSVSLNLPPKRTGSSVVSTSGSAHRSIQGSIQGSIQESVQGSIQGSVQRPAPAPIPVATPGSAPGSMQSSLIDTTSALLYGPSKGSADSSTSLIIPDVPQSPDLPGLLASPGSIATEHSLATPVSIRNVRNVPEPQMLGLLPMPEPLSRSTSMPSMTTWPGTNIANASFGVKRHDSSDSLNDSLQEPFEAMPTPIVATATSRLEKPIVLREPGPKVLLHARRF